MGVLSAHSCLLFLIYFACMYVNKICIMETHQAPGCSLSLINPSRCFGNWGQTNNEYTVKVCLIFGSLIPRTSEDNLMRNSAFSSGKQRWERREKWLWLCCGWPSTQLVLCSSKFEILDGVDMSQDLVCETVYSNLLVYHYLLLMLFLLCNARFIALDMFAVKSVCQINNPLEPACCT